MSELADSIKRLRAFDKKYEKASGLALIARGEIRCGYFPEALKTINQLVELVAELTVVAIAVQCDAQQVINKKELCLVLTKAAPIAALKE
jgi:hypothetical protein